MRLKQLVKRISKLGKDAGKQLMERHYLDTLFDSFKRKDMTRRGFKRAYKRIMDPERMAREAEEIALHNQVRRTLRRF
jgi:hypothetical protein